MADHQIWVSTNGNNSNSGSASNPLKTIQAALNKASNDTDVMVKAGTYTGNLKFFDNDVSLISADGNQEATIKPSNQNASTISGFGLVGVTIKGFEIDGANNSNAIHFGMSGSGFSDPVKNLTIQNNKIHSSGEDGVKISQGYNVKVVNNDITNSGSEGIDFVAVNKSKIGDNVVKGADGTAGIVVKGGSNDVDIVDNKVSDGKVNGISVGGWTDQKWMWPDAHGYEAKNLTVTGNEVWDVNKSAILVSGAHDSTISNNYLHPDNDYDAVIWLDSSVADHPNPIKSKNITVSGNVFDNDDWLKVNSGNNGGLKVSGNKVGNKTASDTKGVWSSAEEASGVAGASGSAADQKTAAPTANPPTASDAKDQAGLVVNKGGESIVYSHVLKAEAPADGTSKADAAGGDDYLHFRLPADSADTNASAALTKWQALEDASALADTSTVADQSHPHDAQAHTTDGWLL
jgi:hypothetical protein